MIHIESQESKVRVAGASEVCPGVYGERFRGTLCFTPATPAWGANMTLLTLNNLHDEETQRPLTGLFPTS